jgi:hypothetical protein
VDRKGFARKFGFETKIARFARSRRWGSRTTATNEALETKIAQIRDFPSKAGQKENGFAGEVGTSGDQARDAPGASDIVKQFPCQRLVAGKMVTDPGATRQYQVRQPTYPSRPCCALIAEFLLGRHPHGAVGPGQADRRATGGGETDQVWAQQFRALANTEAVPKQLFEGESVR